MVALGMVIGFARREPGAAKALAGRSGRFETHAGGAAGPARGAAG
jgi:hypothetical protein